MDVVLLLCYAANVEAQLLQESLAVTGRTMRCHCKFW